MRILVTGGAGFIGSHFVKHLLDNNHQVTILDKLTYAGNMDNLPLQSNNFTFILGDICDRNIVRKAAKGCDAIVNFAAETHVDRSIKDASDFVQTDVFGTYILLEEVKEQNIRFIQVSTDEVYGDIPAPHECTEYDPINPSSPYSASKAGGDLQVLAAIRTFGIDACITRGSNTYGPNQYPEKLIPLFITKFIKGKVPSLYGDGLQVRQWIYVEDHVRAIMKVLLNGESGEIYNIGGEERTNLEIVKMITVNVWGYIPKFDFTEDRLGHDIRYAVDDTKLRDLGWYPNTDLKEGLFKTVNWYYLN